jgi:hypothetical protein
MVGHLGFAWLAAANLVCPPGYFEDADSRSCAVCTLGSFAPAFAERTSCTTCPEGQTTEAFGANSAAHCAVPQPKEKCKAGFFHKYSYVTHIHVAYSCEPCPIGKYSEVSGASSCEVRSNVDPGR